MSFEHYVRNGTKLLRCGYTTGTCAALAAGGALQLLLTGEKPGVLSLVTPKGWTVRLLPEILERVDEKTARCGVVKDAGDDTDCTDGVTVIAEVSLRQDGQRLIAGGAGIGRVTKPGLDQPVGEAAINTIPRQMILEQACAVCERAGYRGGFTVTLSIPGGEELAKKTFNPRLGIEGGLSILGTSGIVEPMSHAALIDTIECDLRQAATQGRRLILTPGNYGMNYCKEQGFFDLAPVALCSNFIGEALDLAEIYDFSQVLLVGHVGKLVKLAAGIMNTHSRQADGRMEIFCAHAAMAGAGQTLCRQLMQCATADAALALLQQAGLMEEVMASILAAISAHLSRRADTYQVGAVLFSQTYQTLGATRQAKEILREWRGEA